MVNIMGKKIVLAVFGGIALVGLVIMLVGFGLGGRPGSITTDGDSLLYSTPRQTVRLGRAPAFMRNWHSGLPEYFRNHIFYGYDYNYDYDDFDDYDDDYDDDFDDYGEGYGYQGGNMLSGSASLGAPVDAVRISKLDVDIAAGFVEVRSGDEAKLEVQGPMTYSSYFDEGTWHIESYHHGLSWRDAAFWMGDRDMSTRFIVTMPDTLQKLEVDIGAGEALVENFNLTELDVNGSAGSVEVRNCKASAGDFEVAAGEIKIENVELVEGDFEVAAGQISFSGDVSGVLDATTGAGSIKVSIPRPQSYGWEAEVSMGAITIDGKGVSQGLATSSHGGDEHVRPFFDLECNMGNIDISFK